MPYNYGGVWYDPVDVPTTQDSGAAPSWYDQPPEWYTENQPGATPGSGPADPVGSGDGTYTALPGTATQSNIPYGTFPWSGMPDYVTDAIKGLFTGEGGTGIAGGVWDWLEKTKQGFGDMTQETVDTTNIMNIASQLADPGRAAEFGRTSRAGLAAGMQGLRQNLFQPILNQYSDRTGFLSSTTGAQALGGGMGQVGKAYLEQLTKINQAEQGMRTEGLTEGLKGYGLGAEYEKEYFNRALSAMVAEGKFDVDTMKALDTFLYAIRQQEDPLAPYRALLDFASR